MNKIKPYEINLSFDDDENLYHIASFKYYEGISYAKQHKLKQSTQFNDILNYTHFIVCCGDVIIRVNQRDFPEIERKII